MSVNQQPTDLCVCGHEKVAHRGGGLDGHCDGYRPAEPAKGEPCNHKIEAYVNPEAGSYTGIFRCVYCKKHAGELGLDGPPEERGDLAGEPQCPDLSIDDIREGEASMVEETLGEIAELNRDEQMLVSNQVLDPLASFPTGLTTNGLIALAASYRQQATDLSAALVTIGELGKAVMQANACLSANSRHDPKSDGIDAAVEILNKAEKLYLS